MKKLFEIGNRYAGKIDWTMLDLKPVFLFEVRYVFSEKKR